MYVAAERGSRADTTPTPSNEASRAGGTGRSGERPIPAQGARRQVLGGLAVLAETVGPAGRTVDVDVDQAAVQQARVTVTALELGNVEVIAGDLHDLDAAALGGPFDLAYTRLFLMHQPDPVRTLRHIADLLRPGGWLVAQEPLPSPPPRSHPHLEALTDY